MLVGTSNATDGCRKDFKTFGFDLVIAYFADHSVCVLGD